MTVNGHYVNTLNTNDNNRQRKRRDNMSTDQPTEQSQQKCQPVQEAVNLVHDANNTSEI